MNSISDLVGKDVKIFQKSHTNGMSEAKIVAFDPVTKWLAYSHYNSPRNEKEQKTLSKDVKWVPLDFILEIRIEGSNDI